LKIRLEESITMNADQKRTLSVDMMNEYQERLGKLLERMEMLEQALKKLPLGSLQNNNDLGEDKELEENSMENQQPKEDNDDVVSTDKIKIDQDDTNNAKQNFEDVIETPE